ncbi:MULTISPECIES: undecaprenyl-phosphate glucose phosphotransferase [unclassified Pseudomonas]|uniref:undecaprenyl-phosphate glucose phosphotransferase n=1 Tax=unclassified Pseudomonas TaxID=196821 RepID=UPI0002A40A07|nr:MULTISPECIES: undecaprenyl-phosphate glucose phosphotransferase [unclassified Pseudomonas]MBB1606421.1 undecaprenyl-phosphate glucose phosphotransferase [Pseudomonas sp. UMC76]MBB1640805.1 undecaprenyl-phosphate glucose phosphotransferase [Pseudomonas sp. UME83]NTX91107.1 undecaprenyl-phosphate glucose phosphotransferase [Pseudomonas sp. UMA643]NTY18583.1 undecaprenyl-phosphate glucose phosphotransferase [Pseudomonas sp. UMC3103]NTY23607.1 undecaprenyl-phosphate glucose phosphotransferase [
MNSTDRGILRPHQASISVLQRMLDLTVILVSMTFIIMLHNGVFDEEHFIAALLALVIFYFLGDLGQLYASWRGERIREELRKVGGAWAISFFGVFLFDYFLLHLPHLEDSTLLQWFGLTLTTLCGYRVLLRTTLNALRRRGFNTRVVAIAGAGPLGQRLATNIARAPWMGLDLLGFFDDKHRDPVRLPGSKVRLPISGCLEDLVNQARAGQIDRVYITLPMRSEARIKWLAEQLSDTTASVYIVPDVFIFELLHSRSQNINGVPTISIFDSPMTGANSVIKRLEDIILSLLILSLIAIPMLLIAIAVKLSSPGPVFFRQKRYGIDGRPIEVWKFRSMCVMENDTNVVQATRNDNRITKVGAILRRTSLDELPQFINVLLGDMSIVGPRPHAVAHNEQYRGQISSYMLRHKVKPGITGWAQVNGWRGETDTLDKMQKRVEHDLAYIHNWSLWWDLKIVFLTVFKGFIHKNAY